MTAGSSRRVNYDAKLAVLVDLYETISVAQSIIFCNTKASVRDIADKLCAENFPVTTIHGEMTQADRELALAEFRKGATRVLVATDIIGRGIDVQQVSCVLNFELPWEHEAYIHRIGRCTRYGRRGVAINLIAGDDEVRSVRRLEEIYSTEIRPMPMNVRDYM